MPKICNKRKSFCFQEYERIGMHKKLRLEGKKSMIWRYDVDFSLKIRSFHNTIRHLCVMFPQLHSRTARFFADLLSRERMSVDEF